MRSRLPEILREAVLPLPNLQQVGAAALIVFLATGAGAFAHRHLDLADVAMLYLLGIATSAARMGRPTALLTATLSVLCLDFFFIPPCFTFVVQDARHVGTFAVMLGVGWLVANLTERIRIQAREAQAREQHARALNRLAAVLAEDGTAEAIRERVEVYLSRELECDVRILVPDEEGHLMQRSVLGVQDLGLAQWAFEQGLPAGAGSGTLSGTPWAFVPMGKWGVLGLRNPVLESGRQSLLPAFAAQVALALERVHLEEERTQAHIRVEEEHLRNTLLSCVSHDLRTPLSAITGSTTALLQPESLSGEDQRMLLGSIHQEAVRLQRLVNNLLDLTRVESGQMQVQREWTLLEDVVGSTLGRMEEQLGDRPVEIALCETWVSIDPVLFEQVLVNLLENALKYSPASAPIRLEARLEGTADEGALVLDVLDRGPGIPKGEEERIFEKLHRGPGSVGISGSGLGLAICRGIVKAHGGRIEAKNRLGGGAQFQVRLPVVGQPPEMVEGTDA